MVTFVVTKCNIIDEDLAWRKIASVAIMEPLLYNCIRYYRTDNYFFSNVQHIHTKPGSARLSTFAQFEYPFSTTSGSAVC